MISHRIFGLILIILLVITCIQGINAHSHETR